MGMENNFEERRKEVLDNFDHDAQIQQRKILELNEHYDNLIDTEVDYYSRELRLANNNEDELLRRVKVRDVENDHQNKMKKLNEEYEKELSEIKEKFEPKYTKPYYFKWVYIGPVKKYERIICGLSYFIKQDEFDNLEVFSDVKFSSFVNKVKYIPSEWKEL